MLYIPEPRDDSSGCIAGAPVTYDGGGGGAEFVARGGPEAAPCGAYIFDSCIRTGIPLACAAADDGAGSGGGGACA